MNWLNLSIGQRDGIAVITVIGEIDVASARQFDECLRKARSQYSPHLVLDLADVGFMGCIGLRILVTASRNVHNDGGSLAIAGPSRSVGRLFQVAGLPQTLTVYGTVEQALDGALSGRTRQACSQSG